MVRWFFGCFLAVSSFARDVIIAQSVGSDGAPLDGEDLGDDDQSKLYKPSPGAIALIGFQQHDGTSGSLSLPLSISFVLVDPLPKDIRLNFVLGDGFYGQMTRDGPQLTFTTTRHISAGTVITWTSLGTHKFPEHASVKSKEKDGKRSERGYFTQLKAFPYLKQYQLYIYGGTEDYPAYVFGLTTQTDKQTPHALKNNYSIVSLKRLGLRNAVTPTNFVFCPYLVCGKGPCTCTSFEFRGGKTKMLKTLTKSSHWFGKNSGKRFPNLATGWPRHDYVFKCSNCKCFVGHFVVLLCDFVADIFVCAGEVWVCQHTSCTYTGAHTEVHGYVWANEKWHCEGAKDPSGDNKKNKCTCMCSQHKTCTIKHHGKVFHHCPHDELLVRRRL
jgi:hypothetical protein